MDLAYPESGLDHPLILLNSQEDCINEMVKCNFHGVWPIEGAIKDKVVNFQAYEDYRVPPIFMET